MLLDRPENADALLVLAHGAGAGMRHTFMQAVAGRLMDRGIAVLRWEFPYMREGRGRPDRPNVAVPAVAEAIQEARRREPDLPIFAGGKSFGGRMTSHAAAEGLLNEVSALVFLGFPLHPAGRPGTSRGLHLVDVPHPMLFVQGTRDKLADLELLTPLVATLGGATTLHIEEGADHGFHVLKRSGRTDDQVLDSVAEAVAGWMRERSGSLG